MIFISETVLIFLIGFLAGIAIVLYAKGEIEDAEEEKETREYWADRADYARRHARRLNKRYDYRLR